MKIKFSNIGLSIGVAFGGVISTNKLECNYCGYRIVFRAEFPARFFFAINIEIKPPPEQETRLSCAFALLR
jgi:hypothetical protein